MIYGSEGVASIKAINGGTRIVDADGKVIYRERGDIGVAYRQEHKDLIDSIRGGSPDCGVARHRRRFFGGGHGAGRGVHRTKDLVEADHRVQVGSVPEGVVARRFAAQRWYRDPRTNPVRLNEFFFTKNTD